MATRNDPVRSANAWLLAREQHGVVTRRQLTGLGFSEGAIRHRLARGRLHRVLPGVYAVGRPQVGADGRRMAAVLACGKQALLSHRSAAAVLGIRRPRNGERVEVVVPRGQRRRLPGIQVYQRSALRISASAGSEGSAAGEPGSFPAALRARRPRRIPVTGPAVTLVDLASCLPTGQLEAAVNEADHLDLVDPEALREAVAYLPRRRGAHRLRELLDTAGHALTSTALERRFRPLALEAGLPLPTTQKLLGPHRVDFHWESLGLVVETDSLRYHRTAFKQAADKRRDNRNAMAGLLTLRFTHGQVWFEPAYVKAELRRAARRLAAERERKPS